MRYPVLKLFHLFNLIQMANDPRMVDVEFFSKFSCSCNRSASMITLSWSLSTSNGQPQCSSASRFSFPLQSFLNHHCTVCSLAILGKKALLILPYINMHPPQCTRVPHPEPPFPPPSPYHPSGSSQCTSPKLLSLIRSHLFTFVFISVTVGGGKGGSGWGTRVHCGGCMLMYGKTNTIL